MPVRTLRLRVVDGPDKGSEKTALSETLTVGTADGNDLRLTDETVSRFHLELVRHEEGVLVRDCGSTNGTFTGAIRLVQAVVPQGTQLRLGKSVVEVTPGEPAVVDLHAEEYFGDLCARSPSMRRLMARIQKVASTDAPVLVVGESGTGKELVARAVHGGSARSGKPFVTVDCGALSPNLVASELFGHERGAFTGAERQHIGAFERANGGTVFLDEIGELPRELQVTLLGALERRRFRRVGGRDEVQVDVRIVAATNRDLRAEVNQGSFRLDLYYRLAVVTLLLPPLRDRPEDIAILIAHFLKECGEAERLDALFPAAVQSALAQHRWPGNVRELRNLVEATVAMGEPALESLRPPAQSDDDAGPGAMDFERIVHLPYKEARVALMTAFEHHYARHWLSVTNGNVAQAAREARMDRSHLFHLIRRHRLREE